MTVYPLTSCASRHVDVCCVVRVIEICLAPASLLLPPVYGLPVISSCNYREVSCKITAPRFQLEPHLRDLHNP